MRNRQKVMEQNPVSNLWRYKISEQSDLNTHHCNTELFSWPERNKEANRKSLKQLVKRRRPREKEKANFWPLHKTCAGWVKIVSCCSEDKKFPNRLARIVPHLRLTTTRNLYTFNYFTWPYARSICIQNSPTNRNKYTVNYFQMHGGAT